MFILFSLRFFVFANAHWFKTVSYVKSTSPATIISYMDLEIKRKQNYKETQRMLLIVKFIVTGTFNLYKPRVFEAQILPRDRIPIQLVKIVYLNI